MTTESTTDSLRTPFHREEAPEVREAIDAWLYNVWTKGTKESGNGKEWSSAACKNDFPIPELLGVMKRVLGLPRG